jgi:hypothetical protein
VSEALERRLAAARERVRELSRDLRTGDVLAELLAAHEQLLQAERDLAAARGEQYAQVIDIGPRWDDGAPLPHLMRNGSRTFVVCLASQPDPDWDGTYVTMVSPADQHRALFVVLELWGCQEITFGGPNDEAIAGHPLHGRGLAGYEAHEVLNRSGSRRRSGSTRSTRTTPTPRSGSCIITRSCSTTRWSRRWRGASSPG